MDKAPGDLEKDGPDALQPAQGEDASETPSLSYSPSRSLSISSSSSAPEQIPTMERIQTYHELERHPTALSRIATHRTQHSETVGAALKPKVSKKPLPPFGAGKSYPPPLPPREEYVVEFDGPDDPLHPQNWPRMKK